MAANGGDIRDYEGVDRSAKPQLPMIAINTTAGTASEMTRFCIITDEARHIKWRLLINMSLRCFLSMTPL